MVSRRQKPAGDSFAPVQSARLQRAAVSTPAASQVPGQVHQVLHSPAQTLDASVRAVMEMRFGQDFSHVRVHTDVQAAQSAQAVNALAYTVGRDVVFGAGQYEPATAAGRRLLAHELTHVIQQAGAPASGELRLGDPDDHREHAADQAAEQVASGGPAAGRNQAGVVSPQSRAAGVVQRQKAPVQKPPARPDPVPGLGPIRAQEVQDLINAKDFQGAVDTLVHFKYMDYEIELNLLEGKKMVYDPGLTSSDGSTSMPRWDYLSNPQKAEPPKVRIGPSAFSSVQYLYSVIMHEYQHVLWQQTLPHQQLSHQTHSQGFTSPDEVEAGAWELLHAAESGIAKMPDKVAQIWENLNEFFWKLDAQSQAAERPLVTRAYQKAKTLVTGTQQQLVPFSPP